MDQQLTTSNLQTPAWLEQDKAEAIRMYNDGESMGAIGLKFNKTRGSVAGLIHRERNKKDSTIGAYRGHVSHTKRPHKRTGMPTQVELLRESLTPEAVVPRKKRVRVKLLDPERVTLLQLKPHHCRFPIGDPRYPDFKFCGGERYGKGPYCQMHTRLAGRLYEKANQEAASPSSPA